MTTEHRYVIIISERTKREFKKEEQNMKGTEKQIKWAEGIKESAYGTIEANIELLNEKLEKYPNWESVKAEIKGYEKVRETLDKFFEMTDEASKVINARHILDGESIIEQARKYAKQF